MLGVRIELENVDEKFLASCWTDNTEAVIGKPLKVQADLSNKKKLYRLLSLNRAVRKRFIVKMLMIVGDKIRRIDISELRTLPAKTGT